jgi:hypothetical protein
VVGVEMTVGVSHE